MKIAKAEDLNDDMKEMLTITAKVCNIMLKSDPEQFRKFLLVGLLMNVVGNMPDKYWEVFTDNKRCGKDNDCECPNCTVAKMLTPGITEAREFFLKVTKELEKTESIDITDMVDKSTEEKDEPQENTDQSFSM